jgi:hypothetical protein
LHRERCRIGVFAGVGFIAAKDSGLQVSVAADSAKEFSRRFRKYSSGEQGNAEKIHDSRI